MAATIPDARVTQRFAFIHALRGTAAMLVVWAHLSGFWLLTTGNTSVLQNLWQRWVVAPFHIFQNGGHLGVVLFFLISGYIITHTSLRETRQAFAVKRFMRIFPPLVVATGLSWVFIQVARSTDTTLYGVNDGSVWEWIQASFLADGFIARTRLLDVTWTLVIELAFYLATFVLLALSRTRPMFATWLMIAIWVAGVLVGMSSGVFGINGGLPIYLGWLILGRLIYLAHQGLASGVDVAIAGSLTAVLFLVLSETQEPGFLLAPGGWKGIEPLVTYVLAPLIFLGALRLAPSRTLQPLRLLGDISYSLYLVHLPVGITVLNLAHKRGVPDSISVLAAIIAAVAVAWVSYRLVEVPSQRLARRWLARDRAPLPVAEQAS